MSVYQKYISKSENKLFLKLLLEEPLLLRLFEIT